MTPSSCPAATAPRPRALLGWSACAVRLSPAHLPAFNSGGQPPLADPRLFGTDGSGTALDDAVATLGSFDGKSTTVTAFGFLSMGDNGSINFNLTAAGSTAQAPAEEADLLLVALRHLLHLGAASVEHALARAQIEALLPRVRRVVTVAQEVAQRCGADVVGTQAGGIPPGGRRPPAAGSARVRRPAWPRIPRARAPPSSSRAGPGRRAVQWR